MDIFRNISHLTTASQFCRPVVVKRFALDTLLEINVAKEKSLESLAKTQRHA